MMSFAGMSHLTLADILLCSFICPSSKALLGETLLVAVYAPVSACIRQVVGMRSETLRASDSTLVVALSSIHRLDYESPRLDRPHDRLGCEALLSNLALPIWASRVSVFNFANVRTPMRWQAAW